MPTTIYFNENQLIIAQDINAHNIDLNSFQKDAIYYNPAHKTILQILEKMAHGNNNILIIVNDLPQILDYISTQYSIIEAAGGIIENNQNELLFIFRRGKWDLPKGKLEENESAEFGAAREIEEETGATGLTRQHQLPTTYHVYQLNGEHILKIGHWFAFSCNSQQILQPQIEEDITEIKWFHKNDLSEPMSNTYGTIIDLLKTYINQP